jgi:hypothetical protein
VANLDRQIRCFVRIAELKSLSKATDSLDPVSHSVPVNQFLEAPRGGVSENGLKLLVNFARQPARLWNVRLLHSLA